MMNYEYAARHNNSNKNNAGKSANQNHGERHDGSYDRGYPQQRVGGSTYDQTSNQSRVMTADDRSVSGHRTRDNFMPPRYPHQGQQPNGENRHTFARGGGAENYQSSGGAASYLLSPKGSSTFPRGGTGATDDSFASGAKNQQRSYLQGGNPNNFSSMAMTANSFHAGTANDTSQNSFDAVAGGNNKHQRGGQGPGYQSFANTATDWNVGGGQRDRAAYFEVGSAADQQSEQMAAGDDRQSKWAQEFQKLDQKYARRDDSSLGKTYHRLEQPQNFANHQNHHDRLEDDDQRSPERRTPQVVVERATASPERRHQYGEYAYQQQHHRPQSQNCVTSSSAQYSNDSHFNQTRVSHQQVAYSPQHRQGNNGYSRPDSHSSQQPSQMGQHPPSQSQPQMTQPTTSNSTLSELLLKNRASTTQSDNGRAQKTQHQGQSNQSALFPPSHTQTSSKAGKGSAPQKSRKSGKKRTVLDQKEHWKIRVTRCYMGPELPQIHYSQKTLTWQQAIGCIADLGIDMSTHMPAQEQKPQNEEPRLKVAAHSDGFANWKTPSLGQANPLQTDFYSKKKSGGNRNIHNGSFDEADQVAQPLGKMGLGPGQGLHQNKQSLTADNFFKSGGGGLRQEENVSIDSVHEKRGNTADFLDLANYNKSPSGINHMQRLTQNDDKDEAEQRSPHFQTLEEKPTRQMSIVQTGSKSSKSQVQADAIQVLKNLRYSDLIYLLNILKLQRSKNAEKFQKSGDEVVSWEEARQLWAKDIQLALSVAISAEDRDSKDLGSIANVIIEKVEACRDDKFATEAGSQQKPGLKYEHFVGPLVVLCATDNLLRAQASKSDEAECISTIRLCFDQFERYYAKTVTTASQQRRVNSMSGNQFPAPRTDSLELQPEGLKNFIVSLKTFIDRENLPCKTHLKQALETITLDKIHQNHLVFPQGSQLVLSQLSRLFGIQSNGQEVQDPLDQHHQRSHSPSRYNPTQEYHQRGTAPPQYAFQSASQKCQVHGITFCPCKQGQNGANSQTLQQSSTPTPASSQANTRPSYTLKPQFSNPDNHYYEKKLAEPQGLIHRQATTQERRQHSLIDFSASRRHNKADTGYISGQDGALSSMAGEYRPFSTIISNHRDDEDEVRPSTYGTKNQPMSLELEHKRSVNQGSKSVQKPKKGILKQSSTYFDSSQKKQPVHFKQSMGSQKQGASSATHSPYLAMHKKKAVAKPHSSSNSSKKISNQFRHDHSSNLLAASLGGGEEPPKFTHAATTQSLFSPQGSSCINTDFVASQRKPKPLQPVNQGSAQQMSSLTQILRKSSTNLTPQNQRPGDEAQRQSPNRLSQKYGAYNPSQTHDGGFGRSQSSSQSNLTLTATSMKYLRNAAPAQGQPQSQGNAGIFGQKSGSNASTATPHSNVLLKAQNLQNRNDSFGMHSNYSQQPTHEGLYRPQSSSNHISMTKLLSPTQVNQQQPSQLHQQHVQQHPALMNSGLLSSRESRTPTGASQNQTLMRQSPARHQPMASPQRSSLLTSAKRSNSYTGAGLQGSGQQNGLLNSHTRLSGSASVSYPYPRVGSARKEHPSGGSFGANNKAAVVGGQGHPAPHTDFSNVSQFSLTGSGKQSGPKDTDFNIKRQLYK